MKKKDLKQRYWFHGTLTGNHAEARAYLSGFLRTVADGDAHLAKAADLYMEIHDTCWKVWGAAGGWRKKNASKAFRRKKKQSKIAGLIRKIEALDFAAAGELRAWLGR
jgi:hypothetical protein